MFDQPTDFLTFHDPDLKLSLLMAQHRDEASLMKELGAMSWPGLARILSRSGYRDEWGMAPTAETAELLWNSVLAARVPPAAPEVEARPAPAPGPLARAA